MNTPHQHVIEPVEIDITGGTDLGLESEGVGGASQGFDGGLPDLMTTMVHNAVAP
jgi:hypothetical protein